MSRPKYDGILFDLDGTLWDASETIAFAWNSALASLGLEELRSRVITAKDIASVCGLYFSDCVRALFPDFPPSKLALLSEALGKKEAEMLPTRGGRLYPGVAENIPRLAKHKKICIVSNCEEWYLSAFLELSELAPHILDVESHGRSGRSKAENIRSVCERNQLKSALYMGDTAGDFRAAKDAGVDFVHAGYGYGGLSASERDASLGVVQSFAEIFSYALR